MLLSWSSSVRIMAPDAAFQSFRELLSAPDTMIVPKDTLPQKTPQKPRDAPQRPVPVSGASAPLAPPPSLRSPPYRPVLTSSGPNVRKHGALKRAWMQPYVFGLLSRRATACHTFHWWRGRASGAQATEACKQRKPATGHTAKAAPPPGARPGVVTKKRRGRPMISRHTSSAFVAGVLFSISSSCPTFPSSAAAHCSRGGLVFQVCLSTVARSGRSGRKIGWRKRRCPCTGGGRRLRP